MIKHATNHKVLQYDYTKQELNYSFLMEESCLLKDEFIVNSYSQNISWSEKAPVFPSCENEEDKRTCFNKEIQKHISKHFKYPLEAQEKGIQGRVSLLFTINEDGLIQNLKLRGPDELLENEAERIIMRLPKMSPGKHKGEVVGVTYSIPITFKLQEDYEKVSKEASNEKNSITLYFRAYFDRM